MKMKALSHYDKNLDKRFGDCILLHDNTNLVVYDCGHTKHKEAVVGFLKDHTNVTAVCIVVSHNDSDHTDGICELLDYLSTTEISVTLYCHLYLKHKDEIIKRLEDGRRNRESISKALLKEFNNIADVVNKAESLKFNVEEAVKDVSIIDEVIIIAGPTTNEFVDVAVQAIDNRLSNMIDGETVMNAASVQLKCELDKKTIVLLCGDASPAYLNDLDDYDVIQLPHHGQLADAEEVFNKLTNAGSKMFLVSDNTGSGETSGGSDNLMQSDLSKGKRIKNTKNGEVELPEESLYNGGGNITPGRIYIPSSQKTGGMAVIFCKSRNFLQETKETLESHVAFINSVFEVNLEKIENNLGMEWFSGKENANILYMSGHTNDAIHVISCLHDLCICGIGTQIKDIYLNTCSSKPDNGASNVEISSTSSIVLLKEITEDEKKKLGILERKFITLEDVLEKVKDDGFKIHLCQQDTVTDANVKMAHFLPMDECRLGFSPTKSELLMYNYKGSLAEKLSSAFNDIQ